MSAGMLITNLIRFIEAFPLIFLQDSTNPVGQTEKTTAGEAWVRSGGGQNQKGIIAV